MEKCLREVDADLNGEWMEKGQQEISLRDLFAIMSHRRRQIGFAVAIILLIAVLICLLVPSQYTASTAILPPQQGSSSGSALMAQLGALGSVASMGGSGGLGLKNPNDLQVAMMKSRTVEDAVIDRFHLMQLYKAKRLSDARKKLESRVAIDNGAKDGLIRLSVTDHDPQRAADMANGYIDIYKAFSATMAVTEASQRRLFFEQQLSQAKDNLARAEEELKKTEQRTGLIQLDSQARATIESVAQLRAQISAKDVQIRAMRSFATGENPDLQMAEQELAGLQAEQAKMGASGGTSNALLVPKGVMQESGLEYVRKVRDVKYYETIFDLLARQFEAAKVDEAKQGAVLQVVDRAIVPDKRSWPTPSLILPAALALGVLLGIAAAFVAEWYERFKRDPVEGARLNTLRDVPAHG